jgi:hypothetical protein
MSAAMTKEALKAAKAAEKEAKAAAKLARTAATVAHVPAFHSYETQPPVEAYHSTEPVDPTRCMGRRPDYELHDDRRWKPFVLAASQCRDSPVAGSDLCKTCKAREAKGTAEDRWHGRISGPITPDSHIAGSEWFLSGKPKWKGVAAPLTRKLAERAEKRRAIPDVELRRFILGRGAIEMDIERLSVVDNQISVQQLIDMICVHQERPTGATQVSGTYRTRKALCEVIRKLMDPTVTEKPKLTFQYPAATATGGAGAPSLEVSEAEEDTDDEEETEALRAELEAAKTKIAELEAALAAKDAKLSAITAALAGSA